jgi:hypothetical protein
MPDATAYFSAIRQGQAKLETLFPGGFCHVTSIRNPNAGSTAGTVTEVPLRIAAKHIVENTARIASDSEVSEFHARSRAFAERMQAVAHTNQKRNDASGVVHILRG